MKRMLRWWWPLASVVALALAAGGGPASAQANLPTPITQSPYRTWTFDAPVCVATTATAMPTTATAMRTQVILYNPNSATIYCATSSTVTAGYNGTISAFPVAPSSFGTFLVPSSTVLYCIAAVLQASPNCTQVVEVAP